MALDRSDKENSQREAAEVLRVEALKRAQIAKFSTRLRPDIAKALVEAVYSVFPPPPPKTDLPARRSLGEGRPSDDD